MSEACASCRFFVPQKLNAKGQGECHAAPPEAFQLMMPVPGSALIGGQQQVQVVYQGIWPPVQKDGWCGGFAQTQTEF